MRPFRFIASTHPRAQTKPSPDRDALSPANRCLVVGALALAAGFFVRIVRWWTMLRALEPAVSLRTPRILHRPERQRANA